MGKKYLAPAPPPDKKPNPTMPLLGWIAIAAAVLLVIALALMIYANFLRPQPALPAAPQLQLPDLPPAPALPQKKAEAEPGPALPQKQVEAPAAEPLPQAPPAPEKPQPSGTVTWAWQLYPVSPSILGVQIQSQMPGYQFVALGVTIWNQSTEEVPVDNNAFTLNVDNRIYRSDQFSTADAVISGLPFLAATTLAPGGTIAGQTAYMIPRSYRGVVANWQLNMPPTVTVRRIDPKVPMPNPKPAPQPAAPRPMPWDDEG